MNEQLLYQIALTKLDGVGPKFALSLIQHFGSASSVFEATKSKLLSIEFIGEKISSKILGSKADALSIAKDEVEYLKRHPSIKTLFIQDQDFPNRLKFCHDPPTLLYYEGNTDLNHKKILSIVGTRKMTNYGKKLIRDFLFSIKDDDVLIISGLAYGVDTFVHQTCVEYDIATVGVVAHGLDQLYPVTNKTLARKMKQKGGILSEFTTKTKPNRENFPFRNRIVAGMSDATIIVESDIQGGSLITADLAYSYNRDVFAFPGRKGDQYSSGCNQLIKKQKALLIENAEDLYYHLGWNAEEKKRVNRQRSLFVELDDTERSIAKHIEERAMTVQQISVNSSLPLSTVRTVLLNLELKGVIRIVPGNQYILN